MERHGIGVASIKPRLAVNSGGSGRSV